jgi:cystathionine beta-lyase/cystathionine gamma-synthase
MERQNANALAVARWLERDRRVRTVYIPDWNRTQITRLPPGRWTGLAGWSAWISAAATTRLPASSTG